MTEAAPAAEVERLDRYTLHYRIARGGMATVYLAQIAGAANFHKWIALKVADDDVVADARSLNMFLDEGRLAARFEHPNLCSALDFGEDRGRWFIAMEYLHGESLGVVARTAWGRGRPPPYAVVARVLADAARGLHAAHELALPSGENAGVVHRDVSPENILVTYAGPTKVVDFGIARWRAQSDDRTVVGELKGKPAYMSPEQLREDDVDRRADVWALGVVLWEVTVGRRLFHRSTDATTVDAVTQGRVPSPARYRPDYPAALTAIVTRALQRDRDGRYPTALHFARDVEGWLATLGRPSGVGEVGDYMHEVFAAQIAVRAPLLRAPFADAPRPTVGAAWDSMPVLPSDRPAASLAEVPDAGPRGPVALDEEVTLLRAQPSPSRTLPRTERAPFVPLLLAPPRRRRGADAVALLVLAGVASIVCWLALRTAR